jgi:hypothetical protein
MSTAVMCERPFTSEATHQIVDVWTDGVTCIVGVDIAWQCCLFKCQEYSVGGSDLSASFITSRYTLHTEGSSSAV